MDTSIYFIGGAVLALLAIAFIKPFLDKSYRLTMLKVGAKYGPKAAKKVDGIVKLLVDQGMEFLYDNEDELIESALKNFKLNDKITVENVKEIKEGYKKTKKNMQ